MLCIKGELTPFPDGFRTQDIETNGATIHTRVGGSGPAVLLQHGYGVTGDSWGSLAAALAETDTVIVPDLRGLGLSSKPEGGYDKKTQAADVAGVLDTLGVSQAALVSNDMGSLVCFAFAAQHRERVTRWVQMEAPIPGVGPWEQIAGNPHAWHFGFGRSRHGTAGRRTRAHLPRSLLERFLARPGRHQRADARTLCARSTPCRAQCGPASRSSMPSSRTRSTTGPTSKQGKLAIPGAGRRRSRRRTATARGR